MKHTIVVAATASDRAAALHQPLWRTFGEFFRDSGRHALVVRRLSKHAQSYREISLLPAVRPGARRTPGDAHSTASARAGREVAQGARRRIADGAAIIETQAGDSRRIPTNVISITTPDLPRVGSVPPGRPAGHQRGNLRRASAARRRSGDASGGGHAAPDPRIASSRRSRSSARPRQSTQRSSIGARLVEILKQPHEPLSVERQWRSSSPARTGSRQRGGPDLRAFETELYQFIEARSRPFSAASPRRSNWTTRSRRR